MDGDNFVGYVKVPWLGYLMLAIAVLGAAFLVYAAVVSLVNRTVLRVEPGRLRLFHTPLPMVWASPPLELTLADIRQFELEHVHKNPSGTQRAKPTVSMFAVSRNGQRHRLVPDLESEAQFAWLEAEIRRTLGMPAPAVRSEVLEAAALEAPEPALALPSAETQQPWPPSPPQPSTPPSLSDRLKRGLMGHVLGYAATTQQVGAVAGHFGWLMMVIIGLQEGGGGSFTRKLSSQLLQIYEALGGVDETGRGGLGEMMEVWGKLALIIYVVEWLFFRVRGPREPWSLKRKWAASTIVACAGYALAFVLLARTQRRIGDMLVVIIGFIIFTSLMTLWALGVSRFMRHLRQQIQGEAKPG